mgnify:CR=1 FL=1
MGSIGEDFYRETKYAPAEPSVFAPVGPVALKTVKLPPPRSPSRASLARLLSKRRSRRAFSGESISLGDLSFLLWASDGKSSRRMPSHLRTAPSAGARHPLDTYCIISHVEGLAPGVYRYRLDEHSLEMLREGDFRAATVKATAGQEWTFGAAVVFAFIAEFARTTSRYKDRGYRYVFLDAGHICQNLYLAAEALSYGVTGIAALVDDEVNAIVAADGTERSVVYMAALGRPLDTGKGGEDA